MLRRNPKRKFLKPNQRARLWSHRAANLARAILGTPLANTLAGRPQRAPTRDELREWLSRTDVAAEFERLWQRVNESTANGGEPPPKTVSRDDCYALYALTRATGASLALEIGTHLGYSSLYIASALAKNGTRAHLTTVDIIDVNDDNLAHFKNFGATESARQRLQKFKLTDTVKFVVGNSTEFLKNTDDRYDFIFIDGDHSETGAYFDIVYCLQRLGENGIVVLHDYYDPKTKSVEEAFGQFGVHWAIERVKTHVPDLAVIELRDFLPQTSDTHPPTSLAVLTRQS